MALYYAFILAGLLAQAQGRSGEGTAEAVVAPPAEARARSLPLFVLGAEPPREISNVAESNQVEHHPRITDILVRAVRHNAQNQADTKLEDGKPRAKRCSKCGGYGGGGTVVSTIGSTYPSTGYSSYGTGGYPSAGYSSYGSGGYQQPIYSSGGCGGVGGCGGGAVRPVVSRPVYQQPIYTQQQPIYTQQQPIYTQQQPIYTQPQVYTQPATCSVCGGVSGGFGGGLGGFRTSSAKASASSYGR